MPTLVTGAAGFAGSHLLDLLTADTDRVVAWHRPGGSPPIPASRSTWMGVDLLDRAAVVDAVAAIRPDRVYHCAGASHVARAWDHVESALAVNVRGTDHLLGALQQIRVAVRVLIPSSALVYRTADEPLTEEHPLAPASPYGLSKLAQEMLAVRANSETLQVFVARPFNHLGPRQDPAFASSGFARQVAEIEAGRLEPDISVGNLEARRDFTDVRDTVRAYRVILERGVPGRPYNVCSGRAVTMHALLQMFLDRSRTSIRVRPDAARFRPNDTPLLLGDASRLRSELGWTPGVPLEQSVEEVLAFWRARASTDAAGSA